MDNLAYKNAKAVVTTVIQDKCAFCSVVGTGHDAYIPHSVLSAVPVNPGDTVVGNFIFNLADNRHRAKLITVYMRRVEDDHSPEEDEEIFGVVDEILDEGGMYSIIDLYREVMEDDKADPDDDMECFDAVKAAVRSLHLEGKVTRIALTKAANTTPYRVLWTRNPDKLTVN